MSLSAVQVVPDERAACVLVFVPPSAGMKRPMNRTEIGSRASRRFPEGTPPLRIQIPLRHHRAFHAGAVLNVVNALDPRELCNGTDLVEALSVALRRVLGTNDANIVKAESLRRALRLGYDRAQFGESGLYRSMVAWQDANARFRLLR